MPARKRRVAGSAAEGAESPSITAAPAASASPAGVEEEGRRVFVLGAGVDIVYGVPPMSSLLRELADFARGEGRAIHQALRSKLPHLRFTFDRFAEDQGQAMLRQLFGADSAALVATLRSTSERLKNDPEAASVGPLLERLCAMAENNQLSRADAAGLARFAGEAGEVGDGEPVLDPERITLTQTNAQALRRAFLRALQSDTPFTSDNDRQTLEYFVEATSNVEELVSLYFMKYSLGKPADMKSFLYVVWMLWAFLRVRSANQPVRSSSIYARLPTLGGAVITFNYTNFFDPRTARQVTFFHGKLAEFLRLDTREIVRDDAELNAAQSVDTIVAFINSLRLDVANAPAIDVPAIVPPTAFKPVMSRAQLLQWADADAMIQRAGVVFVVGYSFAVADEHFNDLLRHTPAATRLVVVNPDSGSVAPIVCALLRVDPERLTRATKGGVDCQQAGRLLIVEATAEQLTPELLDKVLR